MLLLSLGWNWFVKETVVLVLHRVVSRYLRLMCDATHHVEYRPQLSTIAWSGASRSISLVSRRMMPQRYPYVPLDPLERHLQGPVPSRSLF